MDSRLVRGAPYIALRGEINQTHKLSEANFLKARDLDSILATSHASNLTGVDFNTDPNVLFSSEGTCILAPDVTQGPYCQFTYFLNGIAQTNIYP